MPTHILRKDDATVSDLTIAGATLAVTGTATWAAAQQFNSTITVGVDDTGYDVKAFGATTGKFALWDESENTLLLTDNVNLTFGTGADADLYYDGTNLVVNPKVVGSGIVKFLGGVSVGVDGTGHDVILYGDTASANVTWDQSEDDLIFSGASRLVLGTATGGLLAGSGASGATHALGTTAGNALEFYFDATHTTGDMRGLYLRTYFSGAGGSGEAARIFATINNKTVATGGTVNGAHVSLSTAGASAAVSGQASALRATFGIASASTALGGTCSTLLVDTDFPTEITVPPNFAFMRFVNLGVKKAAALFSLPNVAAEASGLFCAHTTQVMTHSLRVVDAAGTPYYIMLTDANTNRTES